MITAVGNISIHLNKILFVGRSVFLLNLICHIHHHYHHHHHYNCNQHQTRSLNATLTGWHTPTKKQSQKHQLVWAYKKQTHKQTERDTVSWRLNRNRRCTVKMIMTDQTLHYCLTPFFKSLVKGEISLDSINYKGYEEFQSYGRPPFVEAKVESF